MITVVLTAIAAFVIGWKLSAWIQAEATRQILEDLGVTDDQLREQIALLEHKHTPVDVARTIIELKIEQHGTSLYAYELATDMFVAQAADSDSLVTELFQRYPDNYRIVVDREHGGDLIEDALGRVPE